MRVTFGAGFGSPSPVMGFATFAALCADNAVIIPESLYATDTKDGDQGGEQDSQLGHGPLLVTASATGSRSGINAPISSD